MPRSHLSPAQLAFLTAARRGVLVTVAPDGTPRPVPVCFVLDDDSTGRPPESEGLPPESEGLPPESEGLPPESEGLPPESGSAPQGSAPQGSAPQAVIAWIPLDEKPKTVADPRELARVRDVRERPRVALLVDRWSEDWAELAWLRCTGTARLVEPDALPPARHAAILAALRTKHPQYRQHALESRPLIAVHIEAATGWGRPEA